MNTAVVTGAAGAIGSAVCVMLADRGYQVVAVDRDAAGLATLPDSCSNVVADLTDPGFTDLVAEAVTKTGGRCSVLVNNAGIVNTGALEALVPQHIQREQSINLIAPMLLTRVLWSDLRATRGNVISVVSLASMLALAESPGYCASKAGLRSFMSSLALSAADEGVTVSMVHPGAVDTPMLRHEAEHGGSPLNFLTRPLAPGDVAGAVLGLLDKPRREVLLPRSDGWLIRMANGAPGLLRRSRGLLERLGERGRRAYLMRVESAAAESRLTGSPPSSMQVM